MAQVHPFRGFRYDIAQVGDLSDVTCPPYDVIDGAFQERLYELHPCNVIRLELNRDEPGDADPDESIAGRPRSSDAGFSRVCSSRSTKNRCMLIIRYSNGNGGRIRGAGFWDASGSSGSEKEGSSRTSRRSRDRRPSGSSSFPPAG